MTPEDFINQDFNNMKFELNMGVLEITQIKLGIENKWYSLSIMKNQIKILEYLKNGSIDEEKVIEIMDSKLKDLDEHIQKEFNDKFASIISK